MRWLVTDKGMGKTTKILKEAFRIGKEHATLLLTFNNSRARELRILFRKQLVGSKLEVFGLQEFQMINKMRKYKSVYIDDADAILYALVHESLHPQEGFIRLATATGLPIHDMSVLSKAGAALWGEAADILAEYLSTGGATPMDVVRIFREKAAMLEAKANKGVVHAENRDGGGEGKDPGRIQLADPVLHEGEVQPHHDHSGRGDVLPRDREGRNDGAAEQSGAQ